MNNQLENLNKEFIEEFKSNIISYIHTYKDACNINDILDNFCDDFVSYKTIKFYITELLRDKKLLCMRNGLIINDLIISGKTNYQNIELLCCSKQRDHPYIEKYFNDYHRME